MRRIEDASRIVQRLLLGRGGTDDLAAIRDTMVLWSRVKSRIELERRLDTHDPSREADWAGLNIMLGKLKDMSALIQHIDMAIYEKEKDGRAAAGSEDSDEDSDRSSESDEESNLGTTTIMTGSFKHNIKPSCVVPRPAPRTRS